MPVRLRLNGRSAGSLPKGVPPNHDHVTRARRGALLVMPPTFAERAHRDADEELVKRFGGGRRWILFQTTRARFPFQTMDRMCGTYGSSLEAGGKGGVARMFGAGAPVRPLRQHRLYFCPLPHGQSSFRPVLVRVPTRSYLQANVDVHSAPELEQPLLPRTRHRVGVRARVLGGPHAPTHAELEELRFEDLSP